MFDLDKSIDEQLAALLQAPGSVKPIVVFPEASDPRIIAAASALLHCARVVLLGSPEEIRALCDYKAVELGCSRDRFFAKASIINPPQSPLVDELAAALVEASRGRKWEYDPASAREKVVHPVIFAAMLVRKGYADACLGGVAYSTKDFLAPCLRLIKSAGTAFEMGLFALPKENKPLWEKNIVMFADVALNLKPNPQQLADIAVESCKTLRDIVPCSELPEISGALISYSTKGSGQGPSVETIRKAEPLVQEKLDELKRRDAVYDSISITTELQISVAVSKDAAKVKLKERMDEFKGAGQANVLIVPTLDEGNMLYHLFNTQYPEAKSSLIMGGMNGQVLDYSRGSSILQIVRGAKLLLLTRIKSTKEPATASPLFPRPRVLVLNTDSSRTHLALFEGDVLVLDRWLSHEPGKNGSMDLAAQLEHRLDDVSAVFEEKGVTLDGIDMIGTQSGLIRVPGAGSYRVNDEMLAELARAGAKNGPHHPGELGVYMGWLLGSESRIPVFVTDPPTVDETSALNRFAVPPDSHDPFAGWNTLSQRYVARKYADSLNLEYEDLKLVIAHLAEDTAIGSHINGRCVNVSTAPGTGCSLSTLDTLPELERESLVAKIAGEVFARLVDFELEKPAQILLTGPLCESEQLVSGLVQKLKVLDIGVTVYPGNFEAEAIRDAAVRIYTNADTLHDYVAPNLHGRKI